MRSLCISVSTWIAGGVLAACGGGPSETVGTNSNGASAAATQAPPPSAEDASVAVTGRVIDASVAYGVGSSVSSRWFEFSTYPGLAGVRVCVDGFPRAACVLTDGRGQYTLTGAPFGHPFSVSYAKAGYERALYAVSPRAAGTTVAAPTIPALPVIAPMMGPDPVVGPN